MEKLYIGPTRVTPEVYLSPEENTYSISGTSSPEDVRALYYPVIEWFSKFISELIETGKPAFTSEHPLTLKIDLKYFNSSSAKFLYDIFTELKRLHPANIPFVIEWLYDEGDTDLKDAGSDISMIAEIDLTYIEKH